MTLHKLGDLTSNVRELQKDPINTPLKPNVVVAEKRVKFLEAHMCNAIAILLEHARFIQIGNHIQLTATCRSLEIKANAYDRSQLKDCS